MSKKNQKIPNFFSGKTIPRNMDCPCGKKKDDGNPIKYKHCHFKNKLFEKDPESVIEAKHIRGMKDDVIYRVSYKNLPQYKVDEINKWLEKNPIYELGCWGNSHILSLSKDIKDIDVVNGYYGYKLEDKWLIEKFSDKLFRKEETTFKSLEKYRDNLLKIAHLFKQTDSEFLTIPDKSSHKTSYLDKKTNIIWDRHSWNKYKHIHFDLTTEFGILDKDVWTYLNEVETFDTGSIKKTPILVNTYSNTLSVYQKHFKENELGQLNPKLKGSSFPNPFPEPDSE